jgi:hypothetical protein
VGGTASNHTTDGAGAIVLARVQGDAAGSSLGLVYVLVDLCDEMCMGMSASSEGTCSVTSNFFFLPFSIGRQRRSESSKQHSPLAAASLRLSNLLSADWTNAGQSQHIDTWYL